MKWIDPQRAVHSIALPRTWLVPHFYDAYTILLRAESALRMFVFVVLKSEHRGRWSDLTIPLDDSGKNQSIKGLAKQLRNRDQAFGHLGEAGACPLMYLGMGDLIRFMLNDSYWNMFKRYFHVSRDLLRTKLDEINNVRNAVAHFRSVRPEDVEVLKANTSQVLAGVESCLSQVTACREPVHSNDDWLKALMGIGIVGEFFDLAALQSPDGRWIALVADVPCAAEPITVHPDTGTMRVFNLDLLAILREFPVLRDSCVFASEYVRNSAVHYESYESAENNSIFTFKQLILVFSRGVLAEYSKDLLPAFEALFETIGEELGPRCGGDFAVLEAPRLLRSPMVAGKRVRQKGRLVWRFSTAALLSEGAPDAPPEFWPDWISCNRGVGRSEDFVSDTLFFPWLPGPISKGRSGLAS